VTDIPAAGKRSWLHHSGLRIGGIGSLLFLLLGFVSIVWTPHSVDSINVGAALQDAGMVYWLGTDHLGRDVLSLLMKGTLTSFVVAAVAVVIGAVFGVPLGLAGAVWAGPVDWLVRRVGNFLVVFPALVIAILIAAVYGPSSITVMIAVGIFSIPAFARAARNGTLSLRSLDYVAAARLAGMSGFEAARRHVLPGVASLILMQSIIQLGLGILAEAGLSYVGLGAQPPAASLGLMLKDAQTYAMLEPALALIPGITIVLIVIALNLLADGLRNRLDPRLRPMGDTHGVA
jgi:peptide/nickel transport system permease protein